MTPLLWGAVLRVCVGIIWTFFGVSKLIDHSWVHNLLSEYAAINPLPFYREFLRLIVLPNWTVITIGQSIMETIIGVSLIIALFARYFAAIGAFLSVNLLLTFGWGPDPGLTAVYYVMLLLLDLNIVFTASQNRLTLDTALRSRFRRKQTEES